MKNQLSVNRQSACQTHLVLEDKNTGDDAVEISCQDGHVEESGTRPLDHQSHQGVKGEHAEGEATVEEI